MRVQQRALCACTCVCERLGGKCVGSGCRLFLFCFFSIQLGGLRRRMLCEEALLHMCVCVCVRVYVCSSVRAGACTAQSVFSVYECEWNVFITDSSGKLVATLQVLQSNSFRELEHTHTHFNLHTRRHQMWFSSVCPSWKITANCGAYAENVLE